jgi:hypothetical protein
VFYHYATTAGYKKEIYFASNFSLSMPGAGAGLEPLTIGVMRYLFFHNAATAGYKKELYSPTSSSLLVAGAGAGLKPLTLGMVR